MKRLSIALLFILNTFLFTDAQTLESDSIAIVEQYVDADTLVIFDIDNTLAHPEKELGSDEWFSHMIRNKMNNGLDMIQAINAILPTFFYIAFHTPLVTAEENTSSILYAIKNKGANIISLTARSIYLAERTVKLLNDIDIEFALPLVKKEEIMLPMPIPAMFKHGILFSGNNDKGETLVCLLDSLNFHPKKIVFVDDKEKNIASVERALYKRQIPFVGIRFSGCDEKVANFNAQAAEQQLHDFMQEHTN